MPKVERANRNSMMSPKQIQYLFYLNQRESQFSSAVSKPTVCKTIMFVKTLNHLLPIRHMHKSFPCSANSIQRPEITDIKISPFFVGMHSVFSQTSLISEFFARICNTRSTCRAAILQSAVTLLPAAAVLWLPRRAAELPTALQISHQVSVLPALQLSVTQIGC